MLHGAISCETTELIVEIDVVQALIASGQSLAAEVDVGNKSVVGLVVPANWTTAPITFQASPDGGTTWGELVDQTGNPIEIASLTGGTSTWYVAFDTYNLQAVYSIKVRSGTLGTPVNQSSAVSLSIITRLRF